MSGLSPEEVVELKHSLAGMAELMRAYFTELTEQGFTEAEALRITIGWQSTILRGQQQGGED